MIDKNRCHIRLLTTKDAGQIESFFRRLSHKTLMAYGRFDEEEIGKNVIQTDVLRRIRCGEEIAYGYFTPLGFTEQLIGYLHFDISQKFSRRGYQLGFGICVSDRYQGLGIGHELARHGLEEMRKAGFKKIWLHVWAKNNMAIALYRKLGFKQEGIFRKDQIIDSKLVDVVSMARFL